MILHSREIGGVEGEGRVESLSYLGKKPKSCKVMCAQSVYICAVDEGKEAFK